MPPHAEDHCKMAPILAGPPCLDYPRKERPLGMHEMMREKNIT